MDCQIRRSDEVAELVLVGSLDSSWSSYLSDRIDEVVRAGAIEIWFDLAGISYLSSHGIAILVRCHQQLRKIGGGIRIVADSDAVNHVLRLSGISLLLADGGLGRATGNSSSRECELVEYEAMTLHVYSKYRTGMSEHLKLFGDPGRLPGRGYEASDERIWTADPGAVALGLGALGPSFNACHRRFGEFLAVAGVAAYRPAEGAGRPDFEHAAGAFVPAVRVLYGLAFSVAGASVVRFEARGERGSASVPLGQIADACLGLASTNAVGIVIAGESDGLVGAALRRSPVCLSDALNPFTHPGVRDWLSFTPEPEFSRSTALVVGIAARAGIPRLAPFVRPLMSAPAVAPQSELCGHFHAAVVPFRPLPGGPIALEPTVAHLFEPGRIETILHLVGDSRPIVGAGDSRFTRGAIWYVPLGVEGETHSR